MPTFFGTMKRAFGKYAPNITLSVFALALSTRLVTDKYIHDGQESELRKEMEALRVSAEQSEQESTLTQERLDTLIKVVKEQVDNSSRMKGPNVSVLRDALTRASSAEEPVSPVVTQVEVVSDPMTISKVSMI